MMKTWKLTEAWGSQSQEEATSEFLPRLSFKCLRAFWTGSQPQSGIKQKKSFDKETNSLDLRMKLARTGGDPRVGLWEEAESSRGEAPGKQEGSESRPKPKPKPASVGLRSCTSPGLCAPSPDSLSLS